MRNEVERFLDAAKELGIKSSVGYVYILRAQNGLFKIGKTKDPKARFESIKTSSPERVEVYRVFLSSDYSETEARLHRLFSEFRELGEWFRLTDDELAAIDAIQGDHTLLSCYL